MKHKNVLIIWAVLLCAISCGNNKICEPKNSIFANNLLSGVSADLNHYRKNKAFTVEETDHGRDDPKQFPGWWYTAKDDNIEIAFWPDSHAANRTGEFSLQFVDFKQKSDKYFLGRFIGMTESELLDKYPNPDVNFERDYGNAGGENHIIYYSADKKRFVHFRVEDNTVSKVGFAYSLHESSSE